MFTNGLQAPINRMSGRGRWVYHLQGRMVIQIIPYKMKRNNETTQVNIMMNIKY